MQLVRVETAAVQTMADRWTASAGDLDATAVPAVAGLSCQPSAAAVSAAHAGITAFTAGLATRLGGHATRIGVADAAYLANEADASQAMSAVTPPGVHV